MYIRKLVKKARIHFNYLFIKNKNVSIISNNCWGGFMYQEHRLRYNSPFIGLFLYAPELIYQFDLLPFSNKEYFTAKLYPMLKSVIVLSALLGQEMVSEQWKHSKNHYNFTKEVNNIIH